MNDDEWVEVRTWVTLDMNTGLTRQEWDAMPQHRRRRVIHALLSERARRSTKDMAVTWIVLDEEGEPES